MPRLRLTTLQLQERALRRRPRITRTAFHLLLALQSVVRPARDAATSAAARRRWDRHAALLIRAAGEIDDGEALRRVLRSSLKRAYRA